MEVDKAMSQRPSISLLDGAGLLSQRKTISLVQTSWPHKSGDSSDLQQ